MSLVAIKNGVASVLGGSKKKQSIIDPNSPNYNSLDRGDTLTEEEQQIEGGNQSKYSNGQDEETQGLLGKVDPRVMSDIVIGLSDGLTVPFALTAGLSSLGDTKLVITGGLAELISGAISMGLGGYLAAKSESDYYHSEVKTEKQKFYSNMTEVNHELEDILLEINPDFSDETILSFIKDMKRNPTLMVDFLVRYGKGLEAPAENREVISALTIGSAYFLGGFVPLIPYFFVAHVDKGLIASILLMAFTLFWFGYIKAQISLGEQCSNWKKVNEAVQMVLVGGIAAGCAWILVRLIG
jgi:VIT1/CCC1 family predicted Fe2+/Mn2+ transporter